MTSDRPNWTGVAFGLALLVLAAYQQLKLPPGLPILLEHYDYGRALAGGFMSIYAVCGLALSVRLGALIQRHGAERFLQAAFGLFIAAAAVMMVWPAHGWLFLLARGAQGVGFAILAVAGPAICTVNAGPRGLSIAAAAIATWIPLGGLLANAVAAGGSDWFGWRILWWVGIVATVGVAVWSRRLLRQGRICVGGGAAPPASRDAPANGAAARRALVLSAGLFTLWSVQMLAYLTWLPDFLVEAHGFTPRDAALLYMIPVGLIAVFNLVAAPVLRAGFPVAALLAMATGIQAAVWLSLPFFDGPAAGVLALGIYAIAAGVTPTCLFALPGTIFGAERAGARSFGVLMTGRNLGVLAGPLLIGIIIERTGEWALVPPVLGAAGVMLTIGAIVLHGRLRRLGPHGTRR
jgi:MFS family permease